MELSDGDHRQAALDTSDNAGIVRAGQKTKSNGGPKAALVNSSSWRVFRFSSDIADGVNKS